MITELEEDLHGGHEHGASHGAPDHHHGFRSFAAVWVAILAAMMAIRGVGAEQAKDELIAKNIQVSDTWSHYQAKNLRQASYRIAKAEVDAALAAPGLSGPQRTIQEERLADNATQIKRFEPAPQRA